MQRFAVILAIVLMAGLIGCSSMSARDRNTPIGTGAGAVGGAVLTNGISLGTVGGAAVGGIIGNQVMIKNSSSDPFFTNREREIKW